MTLLDKAKAVKISKRGTHRSQEEIELAIAWAKDVIATNQVIKTMASPQANGTNVYSFLAIALRQAVREGKLK